MVLILLNKMENILMLFYLKFNILSICGEKKHMIQLKKKNEWMKISKPINNWRSIISTKTSDQICSEEQEKISNVTKSTSFYLYTLLKITRVSKNTQL